MIKRIKYGCFALLIISTLTLSSIVAIQASSSALLDNSFYLTYQPVNGAIMKPGAILTTLEDAGIIMDFYNYKYVYVDRYSDTYLEIVDSADHCISYAEDGSDDILMYVKLNSKDESCSVYLLSENIMYANKNSSTMFNGFYVSIGDNFNCSLVEDASSMFSATKPISIEAGEYNFKIADLKFSEKLLDTSSMFSGCSLVDSLDLKGLNTTNVTDMWNMFFGCSGLTSLDLAPLDTTNVTNMGGMFFGCSGLNTN